MQFRVRTRADVMTFTALITAISVAVPLVVVAIVLWHMPLHFKMPIFAIAGLIPLGIALPVSLIALSIIRQLFIRVDGTQPGAAA